MNCRFCKKKIVGNPILAKPVRSSASPGPSSLIEAFCTKECRNKEAKEAYAGWAQLDRNASDSECFKHDHWETKTYHGFDNSIFNDHYDRKVRVGTCVITGKQIFVQPMMPGGRSGQPKECYEHFRLRKQYRTKASEALRERQEEYVKTHHV